MGNAFRQAAETPPRLKARRRTCSLEIPQHLQRLFEFLGGLGCRESWEAGAVQQYRRTVLMQDEALVGELHRGDAVGCGFGFYAVEGEEVLDGVGEAAVAVDPVFLEGGDGFRGIGFGEFAVGVDAELGVCKVSRWDERWQDCGFWILDRG